MDINKNSLIILGNAENNKYFNKISDKLPISITKNIGPSHFDFIYDNNMQFIINTKNNTRIQGNFN